LWDSSGCWRWPPSPLPRRSLPSSGYGRVDRPARGFFEMMGTLRTL
jgi:hypothetical protein